MRRGFYDPPEQPERPAHVELSNTTPVAAKDYKCDCCNVPITKGTKHRKHVFRNDEDDGKIVSARYHIICPWELEAQSAQSEK